MGLNRNYKRLDEFEIAELASNKLLEEILDFYEILKQSIRMYLSRHLYYTDEDKQLECNITMSLTNSSQAGIITISHLWQDPVEGIIHLVTTSQEKPNYDLDDLVIEDQLYLLECLEIDEGLVN